MKRSDELTGIRCIAVSLVLISHTVHLMAHSSQLQPEFLLWFKNIGYVGVQIFFVLSGFLITSLLMAEHARNGRVAIGAFYLRRFYRIFPAFYFYIAVISLLAAAGWIHVSWQQLVIAAAYLWNYAQLFGVATAVGSHAHGGWYVGHSWSLAMEEQFYWFWPGLFLFIVRRQSTKLLPAIILAEPIIRVASYLLFPDQRPYLNVMIHSSADTILIGCYIAMNRQTLTLRLQKLLGSSWALTFLIVAVAILFPTIETVAGGFWILTYGTTVQAGTTGLLLLCILAQRHYWFCRLLRTRGFIFMGTISYSIYLWQELFNDHSSPFFVGFPGNIVESLLAATLSYYAIERPFLRLKDRIHGHRVRALEAVSATADRGPR